jgi:hypothetical protein
LNERAENTNENARVLREFLLTVNKEEEEEERFVSEA